jgi:probable phosphoglycerate mutase
MIELYLLRHAQSELNMLPLEDRRIGGRSSHILITAVGAAQAQTAGEELQKAGLRFDKIFCSTAVRARQTLENVLSRAAILRETPVGFSDEIEERNQGIWVGRKGCEVYNREWFLEANANWLDFKPEGGESYRETETRMVSFINKNILQCFEKGRFLLVGHGVAMRCFLRSALNFSAKLLFSLNYHNATFSKLTYTAANQWELDYWNQQWVV